MKPVLASAIAGAAAATVTTLLVSRVTRDHPTAAVETRIEQLAREVADLRDLASRDAPGESTGAAAGSVVRRGLDPEDVEAAVAAVLDGRPGRPDSPAPEELAAADAAAAADYFGRLSARGLGLEEHQRLWGEVRAAGLADAVVGAFEDLAQQRPRDSRAQLAVGVAYLEKTQELGNSREAGEYAVKADQAFDRALDLDPDNWDARFVKGLALSFWPPISGKRAEAIEQFEILRQRQAELPYRDDHVQTYLLLGNLYQQTGKDAEAREVWAEGSYQFPENRELRERIAPF